MKLKIFDDKGKEKKVSVPFWQGMKFFAVNYLVFFGLVMVATLFIMFIMGIVAGIIAVA